MATERSNPNADQGAALCGTTYWSAEELGKIRLAVEAADAAWAAAVGRGDAPAAASLFTPDATLVLPDASIRQGRSHIQDSIEQLIRTMRPARVALITVDLFPVSHQTVFEISEYHLTLHPEGREAVRHSGRAVAVWKRQEPESWRCHIVTWTRYDS